MSFSVEGKQSTFSVDIKAFAEQAMASIEHAKQVVAINIFSNVIFTTPVGNPKIWLYKHPQKGYVDFLLYRDRPKGYVGGALRGNWRTSVRDPELTPTDRIDANGSATKKEMESVVNTSTGDDTIYMTNNLPYALRVENGWSQQAPTGMVGLAIQGFQDEVAKAAKR